MQVSMDKKYMTKSGLPVRILCIDGKIAVYSVVALVSDAMTMERVVIYTQQGHHCEGVESEWDLVEVSPYDNFQMDDKVLVRGNDSDIWFPRHFSHVDEYGYPWAFQNGATSWSNEGIPPIRWNQCKKDEE